MHRDKERGSMMDLTASKCQLVSVIVTTYGRPEEAKRAVKSILAQTYSPQEIIIVDDGSRSQISDQIEQSTSIPIKCIEHLSNHGLAAARNSGALAARGELLAFLDDDDSWHSEKLELQIKCLEDHPNKVVYCGAKTIDRTGEVIAINSPLVNGSILQSIKQGRLTTIPSSLLISRKLFNEVSGFDEDLKTGIDHDFWFKLARFEVEAEAVESSLVIQFENNSPQMTSRLTERTIGVEEFLKKWTEQLEEWMGASAANHYCRRYKAKFLAHTNTVALLKTSQLKYRINLLKIFIKNPVIFTREPRFLIALICGSTCYRFIRRRLSK